MNIQEASKPKIPIKVSKVTNKRFNGETNYRDFKDIMKKMGWTEYNSGKFSSVFTNPKKSYILKITNQPDAAYAYYVSLVKKLHNKHLPKISDLKRIDIGKETYYIYLIEKLYHIKENSYELAEALGRIMRRPNAPISSVLDWESEINAIKNKPELVKLARLLGKYANKSKIYFYLDMHSGNIMQREDGTVVITDPYAE